MDSTMSIHIVRVIVTIIYFHVPGHYSHLNETSFDCTNGRLQWCMDMAHDEVINNIGRPNVKKISVETIIDPETDTE